MWSMNLSARELIENGPYPERPGETDCSYYIRTGLCRFGITCRFNHPPNRKLAINTARMAGEFPERIEQPECQYYLKTGTCKFGATCKFNHPRDKAAIAGRVSLNILGYPLRPDEIECAYYIRTGHCKFGNTCKFNHPQVSNMIFSVPNSPTRSSFRPSNYAPMIVPQGVVSVPGWNSYNDQQTNSQIYRSSRQNATNLGSEGTYDMYRSGSVPLGFYALQRDSIFPERPGQPECHFYMMTGDCKFGTVCRFHHPRERSIPAPDCLLSPIGLPLRTGEPLCVFYSRYGICKFGPNCKFDHPMGIFAYNVSTSYSYEAPIVRRMLSASEGLVETNSTKSRQQPGDSDIDKGVNISSI